MKLPWCLSGKESETRVRSLIQEDPTSCGAAGPQLLSLHSKAQELQLLSPRDANTEACAPWSLCSTTREATTTRSLHTATRDSPRSNEDPAQPKINKYICIYKKKKKESSSLAVTAITDYDIFCLLM